VASDPTPREDLIGDARVRAQRLAADLASDAADLRAASSRVISDDHCAEGEALLADAIAAARRLHDALNQSR
jgi:hypothetical protein